MRFICECVNTDYSWLWSSLIGIVGVIVGWLLNYCSLQGKLNCYIVKWEERCQFNKNGIITICNNYDEMEYYSFDLSLDLNNTSGRQKIMRNIKVILYSGVKSVYICELKNKDIIETQTPLISYADLNTINAPAQSVIHLNLCGGLSNHSIDLGSIPNIDTCYLEFINGNNKKVKILIDKRNHNNFINYYIKNI